MTRTWIDKRTANDPATHIRILNENYARLGFTFELVSLDGVTKSGRIRFSVRVTEKGN